MIPESTPMLKFVGWKFSVQSQYWADEPHSRGSTEVSSHSFVFLLDCRFYSLKGSSSFILGEHELGWLPVSWSLEFYP